MPQLPTPQRITIPQSAILPGQSVSIPLHVLPIPGGGGYKVGIMVQAALDENQTTTPQLFEFDTGGQGFWLNPNGSLPAPAFSDCTLTIQYTSGIQYWAQQQVLTLTFTEALAEQPLTATAAVGVIGQMLDTNSIENDAQPKTFPIFGNFYGDFGATLQAFVSTGQTETSANSLLTVLAQLPPPFNTGFVVDVGAYPGGTNNFASPPQLIVGLTQPLRDLFPNTIPMTPDTAYISPEGKSCNTFTEDVIMADLALDANVAPAIGVVFDSGAPGTVVHTGKEVSDVFTPRQGEFLQLTPTGATPNYALLSFMTGSTPGVDQAKSSSGDVLGIKAGYINTGITAFFQSPIMFDLERGVIGFPAATA